MEFSLFPRCVVCFMEAQDMNKKIFQGKLPGDLLIGLSISNVTITASQSSSFEAIIIPSLHHLILHSHSMFRMEHAAEHDGRSNDFQAKQKCQR
eukprot:768374-Hanusia_phi.AAC.6